MKLRSGSAAEWVDRQKARLGAAPYHVPAGFRFMVYEARQRFLIAAAEFEPGVSGSLHKLLTDNDGKLPEEVIEEWARRWNLLHKGRCAEWVREAVDLNRHPEAQALDIRPHDLETYDELAHPHDDSEQ